MNSVTIPGPFKFFHTYNVPPIEVPLPMVVAAHVPTLVLKAVVAGLGGLFSLFLGTVLFWAIVTSERLVLPQSLFALACMLGFSAVCVAFTFKCVRLAQDHMHSWRSRQKGYSIGVRMRVWRGATCAT